MNYKFAILALCATASVLFSCKKEEPTPEPEKEYTLTVKTGAALVDETDVTFNGSFTYDGEDEVSATFRFSADQASLSSATPIPATITSDGKFTAEVKGLTNGDYYYQAYASAGKLEAKGTEGFFKVDFSLVPTVTTGVADITSEGYVLSGSYSFASKKVAIKVGFFYAASEAELASATLQEVTPVDGTLSYTVPMSFGANCFYQAGAIVEGQEYRGEVKSAGMNDLSAAGKANCYIVRETGWYAIAAAKPDGSVVTGDKADWIWATGTDKDLISNVSYKNGVISFKVEKFQPASVVIALYNGATCVWTWHIWMSEVEDQTLGGITFQDRNLGAIAKSADDPGSIGLMFQWGRKDPFIGTNVMDRTIATNVYESIAFSLDRSLERPWCADYVVNDQFGPGAFRHESAEFDQAKADAEPMNHIGKYGAGGWAASNDAVKDYWGGVSGTKQNNDPCPAGYKVPVFADYTGFINSVLLNTQSGATSRYGTTADGYLTWGRVYTLDGVEYNWPATGFRAWSGIIARPGNVIALTSADLTAGKDHFVNIYWNWGANPGSDAFSEAIPLRCVKMK